MMLTRRSRPVDFELGVKYVQNSLKIDSPQMRQILQAAADNDIAISLGFSERSGGDSLYISQALISASGELLTTRRKLKPTHMERTIFGDATGHHCLAPVVDVADVGKVGQLSCWEHIQPLLKYYTFTQNEQIHVAAWPPLDHFVDGSPGFYSMSVEGCQMTAQAYAVESQAFVLHCITLLTEGGLEKMGTKGSPLMGAPSGGRSAVIATDGRVLAQTEKEGEEELLVFDLDLSLITKTRTFADAGGHCKSRKSYEISESSDIRLMQVTQTVDRTCCGWAPTSPRSLRSGCWISKVEQAISINTKSSGSVLHEGDVSEISACVRRSSPVYFSAQR